MASFNNPGSPSAAILEEFIFDSSEDVNSILLQSQSQTNAVFLPQPQSAKVQVLPNPSGYHHSESENLLSHLASELVQDFNGDQIELNGLIQGLPGSGNEARFVDITDQCFDVSNGASLEPNNGFRINGDNNISNYLSSSPGQTSSEVNLTDTDSCGMSPSPNNRISISEDFDELSLIPDSLMNANGLVCQVCGNEAGKHSYYGGQVCNSCRAFFRRSVQNNSHPKFKCKLDGNCMINSKSWKSCQFCRFQKCVGCGMKASWVLTEPERKERAKQRQVTKRKRQQKIMSVLKPSVRTPSDCFSTDEQIHLRGLYSTTMDYLMVETSKFYVRNPSAYDEVLESVYYGKAFSLQTQKQIEDFMVFSIKNFYRGMSDMMQLSERDQSILVNKNYPIVFDFISSLLLDSAADAEKNMDMFTNKLKELRSGDSNGSDDFKVLEEKFDKITLKNQLKPKAISYEQMRPDNWAKDKKDEEKVKELSYKCRKMGRESKESTIDELQLMLIALIMLFSTDFLDLDNPSVASKVQTKYGNMLYRYLKSKYKNGASAQKFCDAMMLGSVARELREIKDKHLGEN